MKKPCPEFTEGCPGCRPVILDPSTLKPLPEDHPAARHVFLVWKHSSLKTKQALHRVWNFNSRDPEDLREMVFFKLAVEREEVFGGLVH